MQSSSRTQKLASVSLHAEWKDQKDSEQNQSNGKKFLKSLLSRSKWKDGMLYNYADESRDI